MTIKNVFFNAFAALTLVFGLYSCSDSSMTELEQTVQENTTVVFKTGEKEAMNMIDEYILYTHEMMEAVLTTKDLSNEGKKAVGFVLENNPTFRAKNADFANNASVELKGFLSDVHQQQLKMVLSTEDKMREKMAFTVFGQDIKKFVAELSKAREKFDDSDYANFSGKYIDFLIEVFNAIEQN